MRRFRPISRLLSVATLAAAFFGIACFINPVTAAASPANSLIPQAAGSKIFENGIGFMWGTNESSFVIARTHDNGQTWTRLDLTPVSVNLGALSASPQGGSVSINVHFDDPDHGWFAWSEDDSVLRVASTADSGASWREALSVQTDAVLDRVVFPGPGRACLLAEMAEGMMRTTMVVIATDDNGATWTSSELRGDGVSDWALRSPTDGFASVTNGAGNSIIFCRTTDGGKSWQGVDLPLPPSVPANDVSGVLGGTIAFSGPQKLTGQLTVKLYLSDWVVVVYRTTDGGKTWVYSK
jgi:photosystem II stability/assembly factor-like uncharacterized protein